MGTVAKLTKEQKAVAKQLEAMRRIAVKVKAKFPTFAVRYTAFEVVLCLGFDWDSDPKASKAADRLEKLFGKHNNAGASIVYPAANINGNGVFTI